ncbi:uncharacterized protein LOC144451028 [Glandiceps talaboti]
MAASMAATMFTEMARGMRFVYRRCSPLKILILTVLVFFLVTVLTLVAIQKTQRRHLQLKEKLKKTEDHERREIKAELPAADKTDNVNNCQTSTDIVYSQLINRDVLGEDLFNIKTKDLTILKKVCNAMESCKGFNTNGWLKKSTSTVMKAQTDLYIKELGVVLPDLFTKQQKIFQLEYKEMKDNLKIYIYDINIGADLKSPKDYKYGVESVFIELLSHSSFVTQDPHDATFFFIPSRCTAYRYSVADRQQGGQIAEKTMKDIVQYIKSSYPYWDGSLGSDHFYICSHDMGAEVSNQADTNLLKNSIALVNTADYQDIHFIPHKDISLPPHPGKPPIILPEVGKGGRDTNRSLRTTLVFFAGTLDRGRIRPVFDKLWSKDPDFKLIDGILTDESYHHLLTTSKYCLILRGNRVWSPRLMDAVWFGCVPVIIADYYHLPLQGFLDWKKFAVIIPEAQVADVKSILLSISSEELSKKQTVLSQVYTYFAWNNPPKPYDAFHMVLYELWQKRHTVRYA